jgi:hypothetical protein
MSQSETNGKATAGLVVQIVATVIATIGVVSAIATPIILMYSRENSLEVDVSRRFTEIETQFRANDQLRNIQFSDQQRLNSMLWNSSTLGEKTKYPEAPFFHPDISK